MTVAIKGFIYEGLSGDSKPTTNVPTNTRFLETDTGTEYLYNGATWVQIVHGASAHTDRTRNLWLPAPAFAIAIGSSTLAPHSDYGVAWFLDDTAAGSGGFELIASNFVVPKDWVSGAISFKVYYSMAGENSSKVVVWYLSMGSFAAGDAIDTHEVAGIDLITCPDVANVLGIFTHSVTLTVAAGEFMQFRVGRQGGHASDTAVGDAQFLGLELEYTADM